MAPDYKGVGDARPGSSPAAEKGQGGHTPVNANYKGEMDNRPHSSTESQSVNIGSVSEPKS